MTSYAQSNDRRFANLRSNSLNDIDSFDADHLSDSMRYDDDYYQPNQPEPGYDAIGKEDRKLRQKEEEMQKRIQRQREKDEKKARKQEEKERKKSQSRTRSTTERDTNFNNNRSKAYIILLDNDKQYVDLKKEDTGKTLYQRVCELIQLEEKDYFGLTFISNENLRTWLNNDKIVRNQLKGVDPTFYFQVKFYPPEPALLQEDITRYLLCLQLRNDILSHKLPCSFVTYALLGSYTAQAEIGDYSEYDHGLGVDYLREIDFTDVENQELLRRIHEQHKRHKGQPPNAADLHFLENAKKLSMYGVDLHPAQDSEDVDINIGVSANGLLIYRDKLRINRFAWPKILKISYKKKYFYIKLRPSEFDRYESTIGFKLPSYRAAKSLWKIAVEHHAFFRLRRPEELRKRTIFPRFNSTFRYTGTYTYHQTRQLLLDRPNPDFERAKSQRMTKSLDASTGEIDRPARPPVQRPTPRPQSIEPFFETHRIPLTNDDDFIPPPPPPPPPPEPVNVPEYARIKKKVVTPPPSPPPKIPETKPKRPLPPPAYVNIPPEPPARPPAPREPPNMVDPDEALLAAIRLATDLDPNKEAEQVVINGT